MEKLKIDKWFVLQIVHSLCKRKTSVCKSTDFNWKTSIIRLLFHQIRDFQYYQIGSSKTFVLPNSCYLWKIIIEYQFVIQLLIPQSFSYKEKYGKEGVSSDTTLYHKVEFIRLMNMNQTRAKARTFTVFDCNCIIINRYKGYAGLEGMSLYQNYANGSIRRTDALVCHAWLEASECQRTGI